MTMKAVIAMDSFKGSLSTFEAGNAAAEGIRRVYKDADLTVCPLADGGEGTVEAIVSACGGELCTVRVTGPLGDKVDAPYGILPEKGVAVLEMSAAAGITLIPKEKRNPLFTTTYGVGEMIAHAIQKNNCRKFIIGIGGSATNDGGVGMLQALGFQLLDQTGNPIPLGAQGLAVLSEIRTEKALPELGECEFHIACDVKNPLCGPKGCSAVYGPQKGATQGMIGDMDRWLSAFAALTQKSVRKNGGAYAEFPGAGAAGGLGFAFLSYLGGKLTSGIELVMEITALEEQLREAEIVITGEGRLDGQSCMGKAPIGVAKTAKKYGKTVVAFSGCVAEEAALCNEHGIDAFFSIVRTPCSLEEAMNKKQAYINLSDTAEQAFRLIRRFRDGK